MQYSGIPKSSYRDPDYFSDSSFEDYYLYYEEEQNCSTSSPDFGASTSSSQNRQTSETMDVDDQENPALNIDANPVQETNGAAILLNPEPQQVENQGNQADIGGPDASVLFIRRLLNKSDMSDHQQRLSMPCNQVDDGFLTREELRKLASNSCIPAKLIDPSKRTYDINLKLTKAGPTTYCYAIGKPWNQIKKDNGFQTGMTLDVKVFRRDRRELCFVLERVD
ncbi:hypothetical protein Pfo_009571 [Paulownia fortunei]|nr:hypothetical protein Pfo_009571 [Paulownia fortunei]